MTAHKTVTIGTPNGEADIDAEIVELIQLMNKIPGVTTVNSCQGYSAGYVQFEGSSSVTLLQIMTELMAVAFAKHGMTITIKKQRHGHHFSIVIEDGSFVMRWGLYTYPMVLEAVRKAARRLKRSDKCAQ